MEHPFSAYADLTDLPALLAASERPLRKCVRVNTLKCSVEEFLKRASEKKWEATQVPWCREGFFIERENRDVALGKDLLHLLGHIYMQEASSMLPVELLDPQPGETVLDMSAAPGSKTTQIAAKMQGRGVIIANDVQEKRLWTLKSAMHRSGVTNAIVTKKVGQWFAKQMTGRFDRVLCDAPCTAQGTSRKDSDALLYSSEENVGKMARLQRELLEAAVHAAKICGVIVYSTCTLTPEENEGVVSSILSKYSAQIVPLELGPSLKCVVKGPIDDSTRVFRKHNWSAVPSALRLWPQTFDTEGFFSAVFRKVAPTIDGVRLPAVRFQEERVPAARVREMAQRIEDMYGTSFILPGEQLLERGDLLILTSESTASFHLPVTDYSVGLPFGRRLEGNRVRVDHDIATLRGHLATRNVQQLDDGQLEDLLGGKDSHCAPTLRGDVLLQHGNLTIGFGLAKDGMLKNRLPRWVVRKS